MQEFINHGLGWLYELIVCLIIGGCEVTIIIGMLYIFRNQSKMDRMKKRIQWYEKEIALREQVSEEFYKEIWD